MSGIKGRGKTFKAGKVASKEMQEALQPVGNTVKPSPAMVVREMFAAPKGKVGVVSKAAASAKPKVLAPPAAPAKPKVPVTVGDETNAIIREYYESRGEEVPKELEGLGERNNAARAEEIERMAAAPRVPQAHNEESYSYRTRAPAARVLPTAAPAVPADAPARPTASAAVPPPEPPVEEPLPEEGTELMDMLKSQEAPEYIQQELDRMEPHEKEMAILIGKEQSRDLYNTGVPDAYVPQTRRGFAEFIKLQYKPYILPSTPIVVPEGEKYYPYQKFVRDYMRKESPYRGILVYHGLGSGKTCTAIAAAEALFATDKKNIIVLSPKSLRKNFLREVSKCGFRHFQLKNFWVRLPNVKTDPTTTFFANRVIGLSAKYMKTARNIWVPDFTKPQEQSNYDALPPEDREEIRRQILSVVEYDPVTNPTGRIRFVSYNGVTKRALLHMVCDTKDNRFFDNAVIIVDEIHNLIRNIRGDIEAFLVEKKDLKRERLIELETVTPDRWIANAKECKKLQEFEEKRRRKEPAKLKLVYTRGYLFYRLLLDAKHSKVVGLSGTPLINFPEELGILANVLHGYITIVEGTIGQSGASVQERAKKIGLEHPFTDYVNTKSDPAGTRVIMSLLPTGNMKISNDVGVVRIPKFTETDTYVQLYAAIADLYNDGKQPAVEEVIGAVRGAYEEVEYPPFDIIQRGIYEVFSKNPTPTRKELSDSIVSTYDAAHDVQAIVKSVANAFKTAGLAFQGEPRVYSEALLPPFGEEFAKNFVQNRTTLINKATLLTRLTGLVSYYKGSSLELMPRVKSDTVVRVPFSDYSQKAYSARRGVELKKEIESSPGQKVEDVWNKVYDLQDNAESNNFMMSSRQCCNFSFPAEVVRPSPKTKEDERTEAVAGMIVGELVTLPPDSIDDEKEVEQEFPELRGEEEEEEEAEEEAREEEGLPAAPAAAPAPAAPAAAPAAQQEGVTPDKIRFELGINNRFRVFSPLFPRKFTLETREYKSIEHYVRSFAYRNKDNAKADLIMAAATPEEARRIAAQPNKPSVVVDNEDYKYFLRMAYTHVITTMNDAVLKELLLSSGGSRLVYASEDPFFGEGKVSRPGQNYVGLELMKIREDLMVQDELPGLAGGGTAGKSIAELRAERLAAKAVAASPHPLAAPPPPPPAVPAKPKAVAAKPKPVPLAEPTEGNCKSPQGDYIAACVDAKKCLETVARAKMTMGGEDGLANYSPKYAKMLENIAAAPGSSLVYSVLLNMEGLGIFQIAMNVNGYAPIEIIEEGGTIKFSKKTEESFAKQQPRYMTFSGGETDKVRTAALSIFNAQFSDLPESMNATIKKGGYTDNKVGEICRVFCISSAGAEGLSLRNVRAVHIMEPYWNDVRLTQVKGRAVRIGSHLDLPESQRDVSIFTYVSVFPDEAQSNKVPERRIDQTLLIHDSIDVSVAKEIGIPVKPGTTTYVLTSDEMMYGISERKRKIVEALQCILKSASVDCEINLKKNKDDTFMCLPLKGRVGDFMYNPILRDDILEAPQFQGPDGKDILDTTCVLGVKPRESAGMTLPDIYKGLKGVTYRMRPVTNEAGDIIRFDMYEADQADPKKKIPEKLVGTAGVKDGKPGAPVKFM